MGRKRAGGNWKDKCQVKEETNVKGFTDEATLGNNKVWCADSACEVLTQKVQKHACLEGAVTDTVHRISKCQVCLRWCKRQKGRGFQSQFFHLLCDLRKLLNLSELQFSHL